MASLPLNSPLSSVAAILHAAMALGPGAWQPKDPKSPAVPGKEDLADDLRLLFALLRDRQLPYLLVGGVALLKYVEARNTEDIDLVIAATSLKQTPEIVVTEQSRDFARGRFRHLPVDFLLTANPVFRFAQQTYQTSHTFGDLHVPCATVEGLIFLKLFALPSLYRQGNTQRAALYETDITMLMDRYSPTMTPILDALKPFMDEGAHAELQKITNECQSRIDRMRKAHKQPPNP